MKNTTLGLVRSHLVLAAIVYPVVASAMPGIASAAESACERTNTGLVSSPDKHWVVVQFDENCALGLGSSSTVAMEIAPPDHPDKPQLIFGMSTSSVPEERPRVRWASATELQIVVPNLADVGLQVALFQGITITLKRCPDDPEARARLLKWRQAIASYSRKLEDWHNGTRNAANQPVEPAAPPPEKVSFLQCVTNMGL
jgi:hypothetical protein